MSEDVCMHGQPLDAEGEGQCPECVAMLEERPLELSAEEEKALVQRAAALEEAEPASQEELRADRRREREESAVRDLEGNWKAQELFDAMVKKRMN